MTAVEFKGSTTSDKLGPPAVDPSKLSHGYVYKTPGQAEPAAPQRWEVASYHTIRAESQREPPLTKTSGL